VAESPSKTMVFKETFIPVRYQLELDEGATEGSRYASLAHELAHLYCGHLGTPSDRWWPDRRGLSHAVRELEAESVAYMVCTRLGIDNPSEQYLAGYIKDQEHIPPISLECVMKTAGLIEKMGKEILKPRKEKME
jgi:antirestriction protein ArdC